MTDQITDVYTFEGKAYDLVDIEGEGLITPEFFGIKPLFKSTQSSRGYAMFYSLSGDEFLLNAFYVNTENPPKINEVEPQSGKPLFDYIYRNLNIKMEYTGKILITRFKEAPTGTIVVEIQVRNGDIIDTKELNLKKDEFKKLYQETFRRFY